MRNKEIRAALRLSDVRQWQVAEELGVSDVTVCRWLRQELPDDKKALMLKAIKDIQEKKEKGIYG